MNYIVWNSIDSKDLQGLMICELPSISKSKMRTQITEIEGKDGDFSDNLGYSAYDKTLEIALTKNYDINKIIKYFTGSGQVTFSNESDKYYNAEIVEQIDFERLLKFKMANVKFHTQPFKYLVDEAKVEVNATVHTEATVNNIGLEYSKPVMTLTGTGIVQILINGIGTFEIDLEEGNVPITVDSNLEECYSGSLAFLKNRNMTGVCPILELGENIITWTGNLTKIEVQPKSRWL
jgi:phage-related protein